MKLAWHDLQLILLRIPAPVLRLMKERPGKLFLAGGAIRSVIAGEFVNDFDLFCGSREEAIEVANALVKDKDRAKNDKGLLPGIWDTENAFTLIQHKPRIQIIHRWTFSDPCECIKSFDFTIAQAAIWWQIDPSIKTSDGVPYGKWESCVSDRFYQDLAAKRLIYTRPERNEEAGGSLLRVLKFYQRGYRIPLDSFSATIARCLMGVDWNQIDRHDNPEAQLAKVICGLLREVDPNVDPSHVAHLPSEGEIETAVPNDEH